MREQAKQQIFSVEPYVPGKPIDEVKRELGLKNVIKLASNENPYGPSPKALAAMRRALKTVNRYPTGDCFYLRQALAKHLKVNPEQLVFGNGSDEIIVFAAHTFLNPGDEVIMANPSFLIYSIASKIEGAVLKEIPLVNFHYDLEAMKKAVGPKTKIIFLGNPDNPAGTYLTQKEVEKFLEAVGPNVLVFIDEAYYEYVNATDYVDSIKLLSRYKNVLVTRTFSKMYGLAGLRVGYGIGHEELIDVVSRVREPFNINSIAQVAALACLSDQKYYRGLAKKIEQERKFLYKSFRRLKLDFNESCTNFIALKVKPDGATISHKLLKRGIIVRDMSAWGLKEFIRITIGTAQENKKLIRTLEEIL